MNSPASETDTIAQQLPPGEDLRPWFQTVADLPLPFCWQEFFGNDNPVEIDVGCGRGLFTVNASESLPDRNFCGVELDFREGRRGAKRLKKREQPNARVLGGDVHQFFDKYVPAHSASAVHVYFPDPWWKRKHRRRRVFSDEFADRLARVVEQGGLVHSWTDVEEYFGVIKALMDHHPLFEQLPPPTQREAAHDMDYQTSYERKKRKAGLPIYRGGWQRVAE